MVQLSVELAMASIDTAVDSDDDSQLPRSKKKKEAQGRFVSPKKRMDEYEKAFCSQNTKVNARWAVNNFNAWQRDYNTRHPGKPCPDDLLLSNSASDVASWLEKYVLSTRKRTREPYPPKTVYLLLCGLQRYMKKVCAMNIFDRDDPDFKCLYYTCENNFRELHADGVDSQSRPTEVLTPSGKEKLWETGIFSVETPKGLLNAVFFFYNGKNFMLRGGAEQMPKLEHYSDSYYLFLTRLCMLYCAVCVFMVIDS